MTIPAVVLWANSTRTSFVSEWQSNTEAASLSFRQGDTLGVELHWVEATPGNPMREVVWPAAANITMALGKIDAAPTAGYYKLSYGGETTSSISFDASAATIQAALNGLTPIALEGGVVVAKTGTTWRATWNTAGVASSSITVAENTMTPTSSIGIGVARTGSALVSNIVQVHIKQAPVAVCTSWETTASPAVEVTELHSPAYSGDNRVWRIKVTPEPKGGTFRLSYTINGETYWTSPLSVIGLTTTAIETAITELTAVKVSDYEFDLAQEQIIPDPTVNITAIGADSSGLIGFSSKYGLLSLNTLDVELLLGGAASAQVVCEVEVELDGKRQTLAQTTAVIYNDLIDTDSYTIVEWGDLVPAEAVVRFDTAQSLTTGEKAQARTNIGAIDSSALAAYTTKDNELESRLGAQEALALTTDQRAAITGAATPSATNVFATADELDAKADATHTHIIEQVTGLADELAAKAALDHTHAIADVDGLQTELGDLATGKADTEHTHTQSDVENLTGDLSTINGRIDAVEDSITALETGGLTTDQKNAISFSEAPADANPFITNSAMVTYVGTQTAGLMPMDLPANFTTIVGTYNDTNYPYEITFTINGVDYKVPARLA